MTLLREHKKGVHDGNFDLVYYFWMSQYWNIKAKFQLLPPELPHAIHYTYLLYSLYEFTLFTTPNYVLYGTPLLGNGVSKVK